MRTGIGSSAYFADENPKEALRRMKAHGYSCMDYQRFGNAAGELFQLTNEEFEARLTAERRMIEEAGIRVWQIHGVCNFVLGEDGSLDLEDCFNKMSRSLRGARILGAKYAVFHPLTPFGRGVQEDEKRFFRVNTDVFTRLLPQAEAEGVIMCLENIPLPGMPLSLPEQTLAFVKRINSPHFRMCLDSGHCAVFGISPADAVRMIGREYLGALHVHDNDGKADRHHLPYHGVIDWEAYREALREIGFEGVVSLECAASKKLPGGLREHYEIGLAGIARHLAGED